MTSSEIKTALKRLPGWKYSSKTRSIHTEIRCKDFMAAVRIVGRIAKLAERMDHHPDLHLTRYRRLRVVLTTHDQGRVTQKDLSLARRINERSRQPA